jgi:signal transduction histidine kinase
MEEKHGELHVETKCVDFFPDCWKVLIIDDDEDIHRVTQLVLKRFAFLGKRLQFFSAYSAEAGKQILSVQDDIAVILLDVVMEQEDSGLMLAQYIRQELKNKLVRIILRTGQAGRAPENDVIMKYDINDYKEKTELTQQKLYTAMVTALRSFRDLSIMENQTIMLGQANQKLLQVETALEQMNTTLELQVKQRTQELFAANEELAGVNDRLQKINQDMQQEIIEHKKAKEQLANKKQELEKAYEDLKSVQAQIIQQEKMASIGQLAAGVAHEINNPMGFIISNLESLKGYIGRMSKFIAAQEAAVEGLTKTGETERECGQSAFCLTKLQEDKAALKMDYVLQDTVDLLQETLEGAVRVKNIVQDLKGFAREAHEFRLANINENIESTINIIWNEIKYKANLVKNLGELPLTKCNVGQLNQVFMNIMLNAVQAIEEQGAIIVKTWLQSDKIMVSISDNGCGIPPETLNRIFEPFFTTKEVGKGTGLGLSISYDIVKKHGGDITVTSEVGSGTSFWISIPVVKE